MLYSVLSGQIEPNAKFTLTDTTGLAISALVEELPFPGRDRRGYLVPPPQKPILGLREAIEQLHFNITIGLLSIGPNLLYADNGTTDGTVETRTMEIVWLYEPLMLAAVYAAAAVVDLSVICVGVWAMVRNGGMSGFEFARVVAATMEVDRGIAEEWEDGLDQVPKKVGETKLRYGVVREGVRIRVGFGYDGEVGNLK